VNGHVLTDTPVAFAVHTGGSVDAKATLGSSLRRNTGTVKCRFTLILPADINSWSGRCTYLSAWQIIAIIRTSHATAHARRVVRVIQTVERTVCRIQTTSPASVTSRTVRGALHCRSGKTFFRKCTTFTATKIGIARWNFTFRIGALTDAFLAIVTCVRILTTDSGLAVIACAGFVVVAIERLVLACVRGGIAGRWLLTWIRLGAVIDIETLHTRVSVVVPHWCLRRTDTLLIFRIIK